MHSHAVRFGLAGVLLAAATVGFLVWWAPASEQEGSARLGEGTPSRPAAAREASPVAPLVDLRETSLETLSIRSGDTLEIPAGTLAGDEPTVMDLLFPKPTEAAQLPVRVLAFDGRQLESRGAIRADDRRSASVEIPAGWLSPGRYLIELKTTEQTHFPLRRYVVEVR